MQPSETAEFVNAIRRKLFNVDDNEPVVGLEKGFLLTKHVAWQLRNDGWFLVKAKPGSENNAEGYTSDIIAKQDGFHVDILIASGELNKGTWQPNHNQDNWAAIRPRLAHPIDVGDIFADNGPIHEVDEDKDRLLERVAMLEQTVRKLLNSKKIVLKSSTGHFVSADQDKMNLLIANRERIGSWEIFEMFFIDQ